MGSQIRGTTGLVVFFSLWFLPIQIANAKWTYTDDHIWSLSDNKQEYSWRWQGDKSCAEVKQDYAKTPYEARKDNTHRGVDFSGKRGSPILAAAPGEVIATVKDYWGGGKTVIIHHGETPDGEHLFSYYFHMKKITVKEKTMVERGQIIGQMGRSGKLSGKFTHLHFATRVNSNGSFKYGEDMEYSDAVDFAHKNPHQYWVGADKQNNTALIPVFDSNNTYVDVGGYSVEMTLPIPCN